MIPYCTLYRKVGYYHTIEKRKDSFQLNRCSFQILVAHYMIIDFAINRCTDKLISDKIMDMYNNSKNLHSLADSTERGCYSTATEAHSPSTARCHSQLYQRDACGDSVFVLPGLECKFVTVRITTFQIPHHLLDSAPHQLS